MSAASTAAAETVLGLDPGLDLDRVLDLGASFVTTEYASLTRSGAPVTVPVTPYRGRASLDVSTGLTYAVKAERARRDPRVTLSFSDPTGSGLADAPTVVVKGLATVRDADLVATTARYLRESHRRFPGAYDEAPAFMLRRMDWYWTRVWIEVTPVEVTCWPGGDLSAPPVRRRFEGVEAPPSDPAPVGPAARTWGDPPDWRRRTRRIAGDLGMPVLTVVGRDGWPEVLRARSARRTVDGFELTLPEGVEVDGADLPACLTLHRHGERMEHEENVVLVGRAAIDGVRARVRVDRALTDWSIPRGRIRSAVGMARKGRALGPRLHAEAARRGARVPTWEEVRPPGL